MINFEGGAIPEEYQNEYIMDRMEATSTTWLGVTLGCARCHDHKYDPFTQKDFYSFGAFFNSVPEKDLTAKPVMRFHSCRCRRPADVEMKDTLLDAIKGEGCRDHVSRSGWEQRQREMPVADVTSGLTDEYAFDNSLIERPKMRNSCESRKGDLTYTDGAGWPSGRFRRRAASVVWRYRRVFSGQARSRWPCGFCPVALQAWRSSSDTANRPRKGRDTKSRSITAGKTAAR